MNERDDGGEESGEPGVFSDPDRNDGTGGIDGSSPGDKRPLRVVDLELVLIMRALHTIYQNMCTERADRPCRHLSSGSLLDSSRVIRDWYECIL